MARSLKQSSPAHLCPHGIAAAFRVFDAHIPQTPSPHTQNASSRPTADAVPAIRQLKMNPWQHFTRQSAWKTRFVPAYHLQLIFH